MATNKEFDHLTINDLIANDSFIAWVKQPDDWLENHWQQMMKEYPDTQKTIEAARLIVQHIQFAEHTPTTAYKQTVFDNIKAEANISGKQQRIRTFRRMLQIAAAVVVVSLVGTWLYYRDGELRQDEVATTLPAENTVAGSLFLSNGTTLQLNNLEPGTVFNDGLARLVKLDGNHLSYQITGGSPATGIDSIVTPVGQIWQLDLPDGSRVTLNTASTIRLAGINGQQQRGADISGEAYFEVARNEDVPFVVTSGAIDVAVLGTSFDVSNYADNPLVVTLQEGLVELKHQQGEVIQLTPGKQARYNTGETTPVVTEVDTDLAIAWKTGIFAFEETPIEEVMTRIGHWYGVAVDMQEPKPEIKITGSIPHDSALADVLDILQDTNDGVVLRVIDDKRIEVRSAD